MERRLFLVAGVVAPLGSLVGCASVGDARSEKGSGVVVVYRAPFDEVWRELPRLVSELQLKLVSDNPDAGELLAESGASVMGWGERVAIFVTRVEPGRSRVEVVSKRAIGVNVTATDWAPRIHDALRRRFERL